VLTILQCSVFVYFQREMASTMSYKDIMESLRQRFDEVKDVFPVFEEIRSKRLVENARSCVVVGCGSGEMELAFIEHCMPSLETLGAVEPDAESVIELRTRIARQLPNVRSVVYEDVAESWAVDTDQVFDVVVMFHVVSDIPKPARRPLFVRLFESVVQPNGFLVLVTRTGRSDGTQSTESRIMEALNHRPYVDHNWYQEARLLLESVGFSVCYERRYGLNVNVENLDDAYFGFYARECDEPTSLETVEQVVRGVIGDAKRSMKEFFFSVFQKPAAEPDSRK